jgi:alanyl-tRNA synthetase
LHIGKLLSGRLSVGDTVQAEVDAARRQSTVLNHSATHLLHAALRQVLGKHVQQKGSLVAPDRLRFDFSHHAPLSDDELHRIENLVNAEIRRNQTADIRHMGYDEALDFGAIALFGEKYGDRVRVLKFGDFSTELCGGTHVSRTGDIGLFKIVAETGVAAGVRRIEAVTGAGAMAYVDRLEQRLGAVARLVRSGPDAAEDKVRQLLERARRLEKDIEQLKRQLASGQGGDLSERTINIDGIKVLAARIDGADARTLRETVDRLKDKLRSGVVVLGTVEDGKVRLVAGVTRDQTERLSAGTLINQVARQVGGKGGGRADLAQAGGTDPERLDAALESVPDQVREQLAALTP